MLIAPLAALLLALFVLALFLVVYLAWCLIEGEPPFDTPAKQFQRHLKEEERQRILKHNLERL